MPRKAREETRKQPDVTGSSSQRSTRSQSRAASSQVLWKRFFNITPFKVSLTKRTFIWFWTL